LSGAENTCHTTTQLAVAGKLFTIGKGNRMDEIMICERIRYPEPHPRDMKQQFSDQLFRGHSYYTLFLPGVLAGFFYTFPTLLISP